MVLYVYCCRFLLGVALGCAAVALGSGLRFGGVSGITVGLRECAWMRELRGGVGGRTEREEDP